MSNDVVLDGEIEVTVGTDLGKITPKEIWEKKEQWFNEAKTSREEFEKMDEEKREALERMVRSAIERMHDRIPEWLPEGLVVEGGNFIDVKLRFLFTDIDKEIDRNEQATSFQIKDATKQTIDALKEMADED